jgi:hypothetical protein
MNAQNSAATARIFTRSSSDMPAHRAFRRGSPSDFRYRGAGQGKIAEYHCWAEFYAKGIGCVPIDASEAATNPTKREYFFGSHDENRIEFSKGRDVALVPKQNGEPLNYLIYACAEADGKSYSGTEFVVTSTDIPGRRVASAIESRADAPPGLPRKPSRSSPWARSSAPSSNQARLPASMRSSTPGWQRAQHRFPTQRM